MTPSHGALIHEGKAKRVFASIDPEKVLVEFKNDTTAFNASKREELEGKGKLNCQISAYLFKLLEEKGVDTHFIALEEEDWMLVQKIKVIPLEIVIRNVAFGSLCKETPIKAGESLSTPLCDLYYKDDQLGDPLLTDARLELLGLITSEERNKIEKIALQVNNILQYFFKEIDVLLVDFKLEMGFNQKGHLLVADEISPDNCRLWDLRKMDYKDKILDKDRFRKDLGGVVEAYGEILKRIQRIP